MSYFFFDTPFVSPVIPVIAKHMRSLGRSESDFDEKCRTLYNDVLDSFGFNYQPDHFKAKIGFYFPELIKNTDLYVEKASPKLKNRLKELREKGIKLVLVTASHIDYTELLMQHSYGPDWRDYFDVVCCRARKPGFFSSTPDSRPFFKWNEKTETVGIETIPELNCEGTFLEGHWTCVDKWIKCNAGIPGRVAYVGDSFKSDIVPTKLFTSWDVFAIVMEGKKYLRGNSGEECGHLNKKPHLQDAEGWGNFFGSENEFTMTAGKLIAHSDISLCDIDSLASLDLDENFESGCFYDFDPY